VAFKRASEFFETSDKVVYCLIILLNDYADFELVFSFRDM